MTKRVNIQIVSAGGDMIILKDGVVYDHWAYSEYDDCLGYEQEKMLNELLFGVGDE